MRDPRCGRSARPGPERRRLPVGWPGVLIAIAFAVAAALIVLGVLLGMRDGDGEPATTAAAPARTSPAPTKHPQTSRPAGRSPVLLDLAGDPLARARARLERPGFG